MDGRHLTILSIPVQELIEWMEGRGPAPLLELASWPFVAVPSTWDNPTNQTNPSSLPNRYLLPPTTADAPDAGQTTSATELLPPHPSHTTSLDTSHLSTDLTVRLLKPRPTQGCAVVLSRIETHVYLDIVLPSQYWNAIRLPLTNSVTNDELSSIGEPTKPLLLAIVVRGATTRQEYHSVCGQCKKRVGNKTGPAGMIDFHSPSNILTPERGIVQVHFTFSCYSRHHRKEDEQYVLEVILKNVSNPSKPRVVSRKELPYSFDVRSSRLRVKGPTSDQTQQVNIGPSSNIHRGTGLPHSFDVRSSKPRVQGANQ